MSQNWETSWTPIVGSSDDPVVACPRCRMDWMGRPATEVEFVGAALDQHSRDMELLSWEFSDCARDLLNDAREGGVGRSPTTHFESPLPASADTVLT